MVKIVFPDKNQSISDSFGNKESKHRKNCYNIYSHAMIGICNFLVISTVL
jgi:hypothetical protein